MELGITMDWESVGQVTLVDQGVRMPALQTGPGVYQWVFRHGGLTRHYVGEVMNLSRRFAHYRNPGPSQSTNQRMKERVLRVLGAGGTAEILLATNIQFTVGGESSEPDLSLPFARCFVENAALVALITEEAEIVNGKGYGTIGPGDILN